MCLVDDGLCKYMTSPYQTYSDEELLNQIRLVAEDVGRTPSCEDFDNHPDTCGKDTVINRFGSWNEPIEKAGLTPRKSGHARDKYTKDEFGNQLHSFVKNNEKVPTQTEWDNDPETCASSIIYDRFGSWGDFVNEHGYTSRRSTYEYDIKEVVEHVLLLTDVLGRTPSQKEFNECPHVCSTTTVVNHFGSWSTALEELDLKPHQPNPSSKYGYIKSEKTVAYARGESNTEEKGDDEYSCPYTKDEIATEVIAVAQEVGEPLKFKDFCVFETRASEKDVRSVFESWQSVVDYCRIEYDTR